MMFQPLKIAIKTIFINQSTHITLPPFYSRKQTDKLCPSTAEFDEINPVPGPAGR